MTDEAHPDASSDDAPAGEGAPHHEGAAPESPAPVEPLHSEPAAPVPPAVPDAVAPPKEPALRPNYVFLAVVATISLALDLGTKWWAKVRLDEAKSFAERRIEVVKDFLHVLTVHFTFAKNRGGAWGLLQDEPESIRRPFFLGISVLAIVFIVSLYRKLTPQQWALKWGLPLVLGGALGNLVNRIQYNYVVDFIDFSARWGGQEHHWPTFNVADIAIVAGVALMAIDMFTPAKRVTPPGDKIAPRVESAPPPAEA